MPSLTLTWGLFPALNCQLPLREEHIPFVSGQGVSRSGQRKRYEDML